MRLLEERVWAEKGLRCVNIYRLDLGEGASTRYWEKAGGKVTVVWQWAGVSRKGVSCARRCQLGYCR